MWEKNGKLIVCERFKPSPFRFDARIVGIGGAALQILDQFPAESFDKQTFIAVGGDADLRNCQKSHIKFSVDGLNKDADGRRLSFEEKRQVILDDAFEVGWLFRDADLVIFIVCLGEEIGSAIAPVFANISRLEAGLTLVFAITPADFESPERAADALKELERNADTVFHFPLADGRFFDSELSSAEAFGQIDEMIVRAVNSLTDAVFGQIGMLCVDFLDLKILFGAGKKGVAAFGSASGEGRIARVLKDALGEEDRLIGGALLKDARSVWIHIEGGETLRLAEVEEIVFYIEDACNELAEVIFMPVINEKAGDEIRLTVLASGFD